MSFIDSLDSLGGDLLGMVSEVSVKVIDAKLADKANKSATRPAETIQPALAAPKPTNPVKGVNSDGSTIVVKPFSPQALMNNKAVVYGGGSILALIGLGIVYKLVK